MNKTELARMTDAEIVDLFQAEPNQYLRTTIVEKLTSRRFYGREVYHAAAGYANDRRGNPIYKSVNRQIEDGIIDPKQIRKIGRGWLNPKDRKPFKRQGRGSDLNFTISGAEMKRIFLEDGAVPPAKIRRVAV